MPEKIVGVLGDRVSMKWKDSINRDRFAQNPFGDPSDSFNVGRFEGVKVIFLPRHGRGHSIAPSFLNYRANIYGMKKLGLSGS